jgi:hypothetical protein
VSARRAAEGVHLTVFDEGIGMPADQVAQLNARLRRPPMLTAELAGTMGLLVVSRLAGRHRIEVELRSVRGGGTAALVALPTGLLAPVAPRPAAVEQPMSIGSTRGQLGPAGYAPGRPARAALPAASAGSPAPVGGANGGLPQRRPGGLLVPGAASGTATGTDPNLPPDPDTVRARLSGLASGLAAAARRNQQST